VIQRGLQDLNRSLILTQHSSGLAHEVKVRPLGTPVNVTAVILRWVTEALCKSQKPLAFHGCRAGRKGHDCYNRKLRP
jgi:hypothetical protein